MSVIILLRNLKWRRRFQDRFPNRPDLSPQRHLELNVGWPDGNEYNGAVGVYRSIERLLKLNPSG